jgi:MFS transporter, DHA3 family, macrolide efflux protein
VNLEPPPLVKNRDYRLYLVGAWASSIGNGMQFIASSWLATELTGKGYASALVLIFGTIPGILLAPFAGVLADRLERRKLAAAMDVFRALVLLVIPMLFWLGRLEAWHLYAMSFFSAIGDAVYNPTKSAFVREIVPKSQLLQANTAYMIGIQLGMILGAGSSGLLMTWFAPVVVMILNAASFLISAVCTVQTTARAPTRDLAKVTFFEDLRLGWAYIRANPNLAFPYLVALALSTTAQTMNALLVPFVRNVLSLPSSALGIIDGSWAVGAVIAGLTLTGLNKRFSRNTLMIVAPILLTVTLFITSSANSFYSAIVLWGFMGLFTRVNVLYRTTAQENTRLEFQGRVESTFGILTSLVFLILYSIMGAAQEVVSPRVLIAAQGGFIALVSLWAFFTLRARMVETRVSVKLNLARHSKTRKL